MIKRKIISKLLEFATQFPVITITGPRQSGKTTLVKEAYPDYTYTNLEFPDIRLFAKEDPRGFLLSQGEKVILDEVQNSPEILSYIQGIVDQENSVGRFILTGSQNLLLLQSISQSLAGRTAILHLLPFSLEELFAHGYKHERYENWIYRGFYPRLYDKNLTPQQWLTPYLETYIERDIRNIINVHDLLQFQTFMRLCAGRIGQIVNLTSLGNDIGVDHKTIKKWLSVLETTFTIFLLRPYYRNFNKRLVKTPKLYFFDTGIACYLLGIRSSSELNTHYAKGNLFENLILSELWKNELNNARRPNLYYWRDSSGHEVDCVFEQTGQLHGIEIKAGRTISSDYFNGLNYLRNTAKEMFSKALVVYGGEEPQQRSAGKVIPWSGISSFQLE